MLRLLVRARLKITRRRVAGATRADVRFQIEPFALIGPKRLISQVNLNPLLSGKKAATGALTGIATEKRLKKGTIFTLNQGRAQQKSRSEKENGDSGKAHSEIKT
jgi:hypothetical protein